MITHVLHLHFHVQTRLRQSSNVSVKSSHCEVPQATSTLIVAWINIYFPGDQTLSTQKGISTSKSTPYHPIGNGQCERYNDIWKGVQLALKSHNLQISNWAMVLPSVLHSIRSLLSTATNTTPHERYFSFQRRSMCGMSLPSWLTTSGNVMLRRYIRHTKNDPLVDKMELTDFNPTYAHIRYPDGRKLTMSLKDLSRCPPSHDLHTPISPVCDTDDYNYYLSPGKLESTHPSRTVVKSVEFFYGIESVVRGIADSLLN